MKIALVCSHGGHLTEMYCLMDVFKDHDIFFIAPDSIRTRQITYRKYLMDNIGTNPVKMGIAFIRFLKIFVKERPDVVVSTGAEIAIPALYIGKLFGAKTIYIECWCRVTTPSGSGKKVYPVADIFLVQWPSLVKVYGEKAQYRGAVV